MLSPGERGMSRKRPRPGATLSSSSRPTHPAPSSPSSSWTANTEMKSTISSADRPRIRSKGRRILHPKWNSIGGILTAGLALIAPSPRGVHAGLAGTTGTGEGQGSASYPSLGKVEGCYNEFNSLLQIIYDQSGETINNVRCRTKCSNSGFSMSATSGSVCFCGNTYPSVFHRVPDSQCNNPCSPDRKSCDGPGCCGDTLGKYFTVTFAKEIDVTLQLLRTLTFDYRAQNRIFQSYVENKIANTAALQVATFGQTETMSSSAAATATPTGAMGFGTGCPAGWSTFKRACYKRMSGKLVDYNKAQSTCQSYGGGLPIIKSAEENDYLKSLLNGQAGWLGITSSTGTWDWDQYTGWAPGEPASLGATKLSPVFGPGGGDTFNDYQDGLASIQILTIGYRAAVGIDAVQVSYNRNDGTIYAGPTYGAFQRTSTTIAITLDTNSRISKVEGGSTNTQLRSLTFTITDLGTGSLKVWGPYGSTLGSSTTFSYNPGDVVISIYGSSTDTAVTQLGFIEANVPRCTAVDDNGQWRAIDCDTEQDGITYLCERRPTLATIDCPDGWVAYGASCYTSQSANRVSWNGAKGNCIALGGALASVDSNSTSNQVQGLMGGKGFLGMKDLSTKPTNNRQWGWQGFSMWGEGQPAGQACAMMDPSGLWMTKDCTQPQSGQQIVCETDALDSLCNCPSSWQSFQCSCYSTVQSDAASTWDQASSACNNQKGSIVDVTSREETQFLLGLTKGKGMFLGLRDTGGTGKLISGYFRRWSNNNVPPLKGGGGDTQCGTMRPDGSWAGASCSSQIGNYVCQTRLSSPEASIQDVSNGDQFRFLPITPNQPIQWNVPVAVRIQHAPTGSYLAVDLNGRVYQTLSSDAKDALFQLETLPNTNSFLIQSLLYGGMYLNYNASAGGLVGSLASVNVTDYRTDTGIGGTNSYSIAQARAMQNQARRLQLEEEELRTQGGDSSSKTQKRGKNRKAQTASSNGGTQGYQGDPSSSSSLPSYTVTGDTPASMLPVSQKYADLPATPFTTSQIVSPIGIQNLQITVAVYRPDTMEAPKLCSMFIYDLTPNSDSYTCYRVEGDPTGLPLVEMEIAAWITQDKSSILGPRTPLENGRTRCENSAPSETVTCNVAYGEGLTFQKELDIELGLSWVFFFQINKPQFGNSRFGGYYNFQTAYQNTYTSQIIRSYIETRNWAVVVPVGPQSVTTVQFWLSTIDIKYAWQAVLNAQGSFDVSSMGFYLSTGQSLTALSYLEDLFFYTFGTFAFPSQAEIIITVDDVENMKYPFNVPSLSNINP